VRIRCCGTRSTRWRNGTTGFVPPIPEQDITYSADGYLEVLLTSGHLALDEPARRGLLACIRDLIEERHGGSVTKRYLHELIMAERTDG
jgi:hypothetical protein